VTENGAAFDDEVSADGSVPDRERTDFLRAHLHAVLDACEAGYPFRGTSTGH
jgi:beta-glucosidase